MAKVKTDAADVFGSSTKYKVLHIDDVARYPYSVIGRQNYRASINDTIRFHSQGSEYFVYPSFPLCCLGFPPFVVPGLCPVAP